MNSISSTVSNGKKRGAHRPFGSDDGAFEITDDPIPPSRVRLGDKYSRNFINMKVGQALRVPTEDISKVSNAMRKWIECRKEVLHVRSVRCFPGDEGMGRVWMMEGPQTVMSNAAKSRRMAL